MSATNGAPVLILDRDRRLAYARQRLDRGLAISDKLRAELFVANDLAMRELCDILDREGGA